VWRERGERGGLDCAAGAPQPSPYYDEHLIREKDGKEASTGGTHPHVSSVPVNDCHNEKLKNRKVNGAKSE